jgi:hypothetical protein
MTIRLQSTMMVGSTGGIMGESASRLSAAHKRAGRGQCPLEPHLATKAKARDEYRGLLQRLDSRVEITGEWAGWAPTSLTPRFVKTASATCAS